MILGSRLLNAFQMVCPTLTPKDADVISTVVGNVEDFDCGSTISSIPSMASKRYSDALIALHVYQSSMDHINLQNLGAGNIDDMILYDNILLYSNV